MVAASRKAADDGPEVISDDSDAEEELPPITDVGGKKYSSARAPFPEEFREARWKLASFKGKEKETAIAGIALAQLHLASGAYTQALELLDKAWSMLTSLESYEGQADEQADVLKLLVKAHVGDECPELALELARQQLEVFAAAGELKAEATVHLALSDVHLAMERPREAVRAAEAALAVFRRLKEKPMVAHALRVLGSSCLKVGGWAWSKRALHAAKEALTIYKRLGQALEESAMLLIMSNAHQARHAPLEAMDFAQRSVELAQTAGDRRSEAAALREAAYLFVALHQELDVALEAATQAVQLSQDAGDPLGEISSWQVVAGVHRGGGRPQEALEALESALSLAREVEERRLIKVVLEVIVQIKVDAGHAEDGLRVMQEEARLARDAGDARRELSAVQKVVALQLALGQPEAAFETADEAILLEAPGHRKVQAWALQLLAEVREALRRHEDALEVAAMARSTFLGMGSVREAAELSEMIFGLHVSSGNDREALRAREELKGVYAEAGWRDEEAMAQLAIAELVLRLDGPRQAAASAMDAVSLYRGMQDQAGEAAATLDFARLQAANGARDEALESAASARGLFRSAGDPEGEARALLAAAELQGVDGRAEALRLATEARQVCQAAGAARCEARALEAVGAMHMAALEEDTKGGRAPNDGALSGALDANIAMWDILQALGDMGEQVAVLDRLTSLHLLRHDGASAVQTAEQATALTAELGDPQASGVAALALAEARLFVGDGTKAQEAADEAAPLLRQAKDKVRLLRAMRVSDAAKDLLAGRPLPAPVRTPVAKAPVAKAPAPKPPPANVNLPFMPGGKPPGSGEVDFAELAKTIQASIAAMQAKQAGQAASSPPALGKMRPAVAGAPGTRS